MLCTFQPTQQAYAGVISQMENWRHGESERTQPEDGGTSFHPAHGEKPQEKNGRGVTGATWKTGNDASQQKAVCLLRHYHFPGHVPP